MCAQRSAAASGRFLFRQQFNSARQRDVMRALGLRDGFEHAVMFHIRAKTADIGLDRFSQFRMIAKLAGQGEHFQGSIQVG